MGWMSKLVSFHNKKEKCLICDNPAVGENAAVIEYDCADGKQKAFLCEKCADEMNTTKLDGFNDSI